MTSRAVFAVLLLCAAVVFAAAIVGQSEAATTRGTPDASPAGSPVASPVASPVGGGRLLATVQAKQSVTAAVKSATAQVFAVRIRQRQGAARSGSDQRSADGDSGGPGRDG